MQNSDDDDIDDENGDNNETIRKFLQMLPRLAFSGCNYNYLTLLQQMSRSDGATEIEKDAQHTHSEERVDATERARKMDAEEGININK